jgi:hypothetical protein
LQKKKVTLLMAMMNWKTFNSQTMRNARKLGFRSGFEVRIAKQLDTLQVSYDYEKLKVGYTKPSKSTLYTPDFVLKNNNIILEVKGLFNSKDRQKHLLVKEQHPELDIRFIFSNSKSKLNKTSKTTYGMWCERYGFLYADNTVPKEWIDAK